jgi:hypothetical protein
MKKYFIIILIASLFACHPKNIKENNSTSAPKVSVYYLHQTKGCMTCKAIGKISKATTDKYFQKEIKDGLVAYFDLDISLPSNDSIAKKFECTWSGLYVSFFKNGKNVAEDLTDVAFMYAVSKPDTLEQIVKFSIDNKL